MSPTGIFIEDYNEAWPNLFLEEKNLLLDSIGSWVVAVEHIGSTAVPGLAAKPVLDIMIGVRTLEVADRFCLQPMADLAYLYFKKYEDQFPERRFFQKITAEGIKTHHVHMVIEGGAFWTRHLLFRDYLRSHPAIAREYELIKRELAPRFTDVNEYAGAKTAFIRSVEKRAQNWLDNRPIEDAVASGGTS